MLKILVLDDSTERLDTFLRNYPGAACVTTAAWAIFHLKQRDWDIVFLDHDLGGMVFVDSGREDTGMEVVRWVEANHPKVETFVCHSWNMPAALEMTDRLRRAGYNVHQVAWFPGMGKIVA